MSKPKLYDVVGVNCETNTVKIYAEGKTLPNAEAIVTMAVQRRGLDEEFFAECPAGKFKEGDQYTNH
jgi:hypothetical protein